MSSKRLEKMDGCDMSKFLMQENRSAMQGIDDGHKKAKGEGRDYIDRHVKAPDAGIAFPNRNMSDAFISNLEDSQNVYR